MSEPEYPSVPFIGSEYNVIIADELENGKYTTEPLPEFGEWDTLVLTRGETEFTAGDTIYVWILDLNPNKEQVLLTASDFGKESLPESMRPRYVRAAQHMRWLCQQATFPDLSDIDDGSIEELKGMINECIKKDQWHWCTVYEAWGRPPQSELQKAISAIGELRSGLGEVNREKAIRGYENFQKTDFPDRLPALIAKFRTDSDSFKQVSNQKLLSALQHMDEFEFEQLVADLWRNIGYTASTTAKTRDGGKDIVAYRDQPNEDKVAIEAKRYIERSKVHSGIIDDLADTIQNGNFDQGILVTTSTFNELADVGALEYGIQLVDGDRLISLIERRDLYSVVDSYLIDEY